MIVSHGIARAKAALAAGMACGVLAGLAAALWQPSAVLASPPLSSFIRPPKEVPAQARLIAAGLDEATGRYRAVVEIALAEGYKTYWREPGDSGVPTAFDWEGSVNAAAIGVRYPTPVRFFDGIGHAIGYLKTVRFPVEIVPAATDRPVSLRLELAFGVCREICIPEQASLSATLSDIPDIAGLWEDALALVPTRVDGEGAAGGLAVDGAQLAGGRLRLAVSGDVGTDGDVFVEGPAGWRFGRPSREARQGGAMFDVPVEHPGFDAPAALTVTLSGAARSIETRVELPPSR